MLVDGDATGLSTSSGLDEEVILVDPGTVKPVGLGPLAVGEGRARAGGPRRGVEILVGILLPGRDGPQGVRGRTRATEGQV